VRRVIAAFPSPPQSRTATRHRALATWSAASHRRFPIAAPNPHRYPAPCANHLECGESSPLSHHRPRAADTQRSSSYTFSGQQSGQSRQRTEGSFRREGSTRSAAGRWSGQSTRQRSFTLQADSSESREILIPSVGAREQTSTTRSMNQTLSGTATASFTQAFRWQSPGEYRGQGTYEASDTRSESTTVQESGSKTVTTATLERTASWSSSLAGTLTVQSGTQSSFEQENWDVWVQGTATQTSTQDSSGTSTYQSSWTLDGPYVSGNGTAQQQAAHSTQTTNTLNSTFEQTPYALLGSSTVSVGLSGNGSSSSSSEGTRTYAVGSEANGTRLTRTWDESISTTETTSSQNSSTQEFTDDSVTESGQYQVTRTLQRTIQRSETNERQTRDDWERETLVLTRNETEQHTLNGTFPLQGQGADSEQVSEARQTDYTESRTTTFEAFYRDVYGDDFWPRQTVRVDETVSTNRSGFEQISTTKESAGGQTLSENTQLSSLEQGHRETTRSTSVNFSRGVMSPELVGWDETISLERTEDWTIQVTPTADGASQTSRSYTSTATIQAQGEGSRLGLEVDPYTGAMGKVAERSYQERAYRETVLEQRTATARSQGQELQVEGTLQEWRYERQPLANGRPTRTLRSSRAFWTDTKAQKQLLFQRPHTGESFPVVIQGYPSERSEQRLTETQSYRLRRSDEQYSERYDADEVLSQRQANGTFQERQDYWSQQQSSSLYTFAPQRAGQEGELTRGCAANGPVAYDNRLCYFQAQEGTTRRSLRDGGTYAETLDTAGQRQSRSGQFLLLDARTMARAAVGRQGVEQTFGHGANGQQGSTSRQGARRGHDTEQRKVRYRALGTYEQQGPEYLGWNVLFVIPEAVRQQSTTQWEAFEQLRKGRPDPEHGGPVSLQRITWEFTAPQRRDAVVRALHVGLGSRVRPRGNELPLPAQIGGFFVSARQEEESWQYEAWTVEATGLQSVRHELPTDLAVVDWVDSDVARSVWAERFREARGGVDANSGDDPPPPPVGQALYRRTDTGTYLARTDWPTPFIMPPYAPALAGGFVEPVGAVQATYTAESQERMTQATYSRAKTKDWKSGWNWSYTVMSEDSEAWYERQGTETGRRDQTQRPEAMPVAVGLADDGPPPETLAITEVRKQQQNKLREDRQQVGPVGMAVKEALALQATATLWIEKTAAEQDARWRLEIVGQATRTEPDPNLVFGLGPGGAMNIAAGHRTPETVAIEVEVPEPDQAGNPQWNQGMPREGEVSQIVSYVLQQAIEESKSFWYRLQEKLIAAKEAVKRAFEVAWQVAKTVAWLAWEIINPVDDVVAAIRHFREGNYLGALYRGAWVVASLFPALRGAKVGIKGVKVAAALGPKLLRGAAGLGAKLMAKAGPQLGKVLKVAAAAAVRKTAKAFSSGAQLLKRAASKVPELIKKVDPLRWLKGLRDFVRRLFLGRPKACFVPGTPVTLTAGGSRWRWTLPWAPLHNAAAAAEPLPPAAAVTVLLLGAGLAAAGPPPQRPRRRRLSPTEVGPLLSRRDTCMQPPL